jgi:hypothetical protein
VSPMLHTECCVVDGHHRLDMQHGIWKRRAPIDASSLPLRLACDLKGAAELKKPPHQEFELGRQRVLGRVSEARA